MIVGYDITVEEYMITLYKSLSEKDRRRYSAIEAVKLGYGGITYICKLFGCDEKTVQKGIRDLQDQEKMNQKGVRQSGGGRPSKIDIYEGIDEAFLEILKNDTAGSPVDESIKWTNLSNKEIKNSLFKKGFDVGRDIIKKLLHKHGFVRRKLSKKKPQGKTRIETNSLGK